MGREKPARRSKWPTKSALMPRALARLVYHGWVVFALHQIFRYPLVDVRRDARRLGTFSPSPR